MCCARCHIGHKYGGEHSGSDVFGTHEYIVVNYYWLILSIGYFSNLNNMGYPNILINDIVL